VDKSIYGELKMYLYSKSTFFHRNLDKNAFIEYYYTRMKNKIKLISYLLILNTLAVPMALTWIALGLPIYIIKACYTCFMDIFIPIMNTNKEAWNFIPHLEQKKPTEQKETKKEIPEWLQ